MREEEREDEEEGMGGAGSRELADFVVFATEPTRSGSRGGAVSGWLWPQ
jgi:hypothetical protein